MLSCRPCNLASVLIWLSFAPEFLGILSIIAALRFALLSKDSAGAELLQLSWQRILQSEDKPRYSESESPTPGARPRLAVMLCFTDRMTLFQKLPSPLSSRLQNS